MNALIKTSRLIDALNSRIGKILSWLIVVVVVVSASNATVRKVLNISSNAWLELQWVLFGVVFLLCSPWTLLTNEHVRIDIVNNVLPRRVRDIIELVGHFLFLLPLTIVMVVTSIPFFLRSFRINEQSTSAGGLPQWPAKSLIMIGFALLLLQGISEIIKRIAIMQGRLADPRARGSSSAEAEVERFLAAANPDGR